ncbi:hypothetical protein OQJ68_16150, partial [Microbulbifer thermotolerans]
GEIHQSVTIWLTQNFEHPQSLSANREFTVSERLLSPFQTPTTYQTLSNHGDLLTISTFS